MNIVDGLDLDEPTGHMVYLFNNKHPQHFDNVCRAVFENKGYHGFLKDDKAKETRLDIPAFFDELFRLAGEREAQALCIILDDALSSIDSEETIKSKRTDVETKTQELLDLATSMSIRLDCLEVDSTSVSMDGFAEQAERLGYMLMEAWVILRGGFRPIQCYTEIDDPNYPLFRAYTFGYAVSENIPEEYKQPKAA